MYGDRLPRPLRRPRNDVFGGEAEGRGNPIAVYGDRLPRPLRRPRNDVFVGGLLAMTFLGASSLFPRHCEAEGRGNPVACVMP